MQVHENLYNFIESNIRISPASVTSENEGFREQAYRPITFMHQSFVLLAGFESWKCHLNH